MFTSSPHNGLPQASAFLGLVLLGASIARRQLDVVGLSLALAASALLVGAILRAGTRRRADAQPTASVEPPPAPQPSEVFVPTSAEVVSESAEDQTASAIHANEAAPVEQPEPEALAVLEVPALPATTVTAPEPEQPPMTLLDLGSLTEQLTTTDDPIDVLKRFVGDIRTREAEEPDGSPEAPSPLERYAARMLSEAGLFETDLELPRIDVVQLHTSHLFYLRSRDLRIPYLALQRILRIEAALNAIRFARTSLGARATMEEAYRFNQRLARSIVAQALPIDQPLELGQMGRGDGEWAVRYGISQAIETLQLPHRLTARYRTNVPDGNVAIEFDYTPAELFPSSCLMDDLGIIPTTGDLRQRAAADYALRLAVLLAASAFRCSERIQHVWVAAVHKTAEHRSCYLSVDFDRWRFSRIDLEDPGSLDELYRSFAPVLRYEDGWLRPVRQSFHLEETRFCPPRRYLPVSLSSRRLDGSVARQLGCDHVSGLAIEEGDGRALVASAIMLRLAPSDDRSATQKNVRTVLELAGDDPDPTVRSAAERVVRRLVDGSLDSDALAVGEEFVRGDALTRATDRAKELLMLQKPVEAHALLATLIAQIDGAGIYEDSPSVAYRYFGSYVERTLYNRLSAEDGDRRTVLLVPDAYYEAHLILSVTSLMQGDPDAALLHAQRLCELAPLDSRASLHLVKCLEETDRDDEAINELCRLLEHAHDPLGVGFAYYRLAFFQWKRAEVALAQACYELAMRFVPAAVPMMAMELSVLYLQNASELSSELTQEQAETVIAAHGIPLAPTEHTSKLFYECAQASLDAEIFPVARNFASVLGAFSSDDVLAGLIRSLEDAPDQ